MIEEWHQISDTQYSVSNFGHIRNDRTHFTSNTYGHQDNGSGYQMCRVKYKDKMITLGYIHRLVARYFVPNPDNKPDVDHINGHKDDNRAENLRWVTKSENMRNPVTHIKLEHNRGLSGYHRVYDNPEHTKYHMEKDK